MHLHSDDQKNSRKLIADIMAQKINNEVLTKRMVPDFALGCRRMTPGSAYLESLTKENIEVIHESVVRLTKTGVVDAAGVEHEVDVVVGDYNDSSEAMVTRIQWTDPGIGLRDRIRHVLCSPFQSHRKTRCRHCRAIR